MAIKQDIIDELLTDYKNPEDLLGEDGIFKELKKALLERALSAELSDHLGYENLYISEHSVLDLFDEIKELLNSDKKYTTHKSLMYFKKENSTRLSLKKNHDIYPVVERLHWFDKGQRKLIMGKRSTDELKGMTGKARTLFMQEDTSGDTISFISYTDMRRRSKAYTQYSKEAKPKLLAAIEAAQQTADAKIKGIREAQQKKKNNRAQLLGGFK
ncbi:MAG: hypothetical protein ISR45_00170 [Rhodospirillales bacterium]|nr:hypothetical protein [Rhodospirillales bacterium]